MCPTNDILIRKQVSVGHGFYHPPANILHSFKLETQDTPHILLFTTFPSQRAHEEPGSKSKNIPISEDTTSLVKELVAILRKLPTEPIPSRDIYERNIGISWWGLDGFTWRNAECLGCGMSIPIRMMLTEEDKKAFDRAVEITEVLVGTGVARES